MPRTLNPPLSVKVVNDPANYDNRYPDAKQQTNSHPENPAVTPPIILSRKSHHFR
jgi:hypothetical protein